MAQRRLAVVVVAAGSGTRLGAATAKAFVELAGASILEHALRVVAQLPNLSTVAVVVPAGSLRESLGIVKRAGVTAAIVAGGATRSESVRAGLEAIASTGGADIVLVHDAARMLTPLSVFEQVIAEVARTGDGVVPVRPVVDSMSMVDADARVLGAVDRAQLRIVQTPQGFVFEQLRAAYEQAASAASAQPIEFSDDATLAIEHGITVRSVPGDARSRKITTADDLQWAAEQLDALPTATPPSRVGVGVDAHAFSTESAAELWLAGLHWPGEPGLEGHSDGDVVCHALVDALLGAAGLGDIGGLFGTDDPRFAGARGEVFVRAARERVEAAGWRILNASIELVGNRPKLAPRRAEAEQRLGELLAAPVNLAATTTDGLGLSGEGRGVGAIATVLLGPAAAERADES